VIIIDEEAEIGEGLLPSTGRGYFSRTAIKDQQYPAS
jgi:hypothetical protein